MTDRHTRFIVDTLVDLYREWPVVNPEESLKGIWNNKRPKRIGKDGFNRACDVLMLASEVIDES